MPNRAALSLVNANVAAPINAALALNVLSDNSVAYATRSRRLRPSRASSNNQNVDGRQCSAHRPPSTHRLERSVGPCPDRSRVNRELAWPR